MIFMQSHQTRRFIGRLNPGQEVIASLAEVCREKGIRCGEVRATGFLRNVVLEVFHHGQHRYRPIILGPVAYQLTSFDGNVSVLADGELAVHIHATLLPDLGTGNGTLVGGRVQSAEVIAFEFVLDTFDDFTLLRSLDAETGFEQWVQLDLSGGRSTAIPDHGHPQTAPTPTLSFDSDTEEDEDTEEEEGETIELVAGDLLDHPRLKRCEVVSSDGERAVIRLQSGRSAELHLGVVRLLQTGTDAAGHRMFQVEIRRRQ